MKHLFTKPTRPVDPQEDSFELLIVNTSKIFWFPQHALWSVTVYVVELQSTLLNTNSIYKGLWSILYDALELNNGRYK